MIRDLAPLRNDLLSRIAILDGSAWVGSSPVWSPLKLLDYNGRRLGGPGEVVVFVGSGHERAVEELVAAFDRVTSTRRPEVVVLEAETGLGKTRVLQELYRRLAAQRQGVPPYWPARLTPGETDDVLRDRKQIAPAMPFTIPGGAPLSYLWWGILCDESEDGVPLPRLLDSARQFEAHARHLAEEPPDRVGTALTFVQNVVGVAGLASPLELTFNALDVAKTSATWIQRWRGKRQASKELLADRKVDLSSLTDDERCIRLADAVRRAANTGLTIVVVVDDGHHADPSLVSFLRQLMQVDEGGLLIVAAVWPSLVKLRMEGSAASFGALLQSSEGQLGQRFARIGVPKLARENVDTLLLEAAPLTRREVLDRFSDVIDGNPLLLRLYLGMDVIKRDIRDGALDTDPAVFGGLPADARGVWQQLWRQLPEATRLALAIGAVQGPEFDPGFLRRAAAELQAFEAARSGIEQASLTFGWITLPDAGPASFTERLRYEVARDNQVQQLDPGQIDAVYRALAAHTTEVRASPSWPQLPPSNRRSLLRALLAAARAVPDAATPASVAEVAFELSELEENDGNLDAALEAARTAVSTASDGGLDAPALVVFQTRQGLLERRAGDVDRAFEALSAAEVLAREALGSGSEITAALEEETSELAAVPVDADPVASETRPWVGWTVRPVSGVFELPVGDIAAIIEEVVAAEGPLTHGRLCQLLVQAADLRRSGRLMREQVERAIRASARRGAIVDVAPFRGCEPADRIVAAARGPRVVVRDRGGRELDEIPFTELVAVAARFLDADPDASRETVTRGVMNAYGITRLTTAVRELMDRAVRAAERDRTTAAADDAAWERVHRAVAAIPRGQWTSLADLAELRGTSTGWVGRHLYGRWDLPGLHRVFDTTAKPLRWFQWPAGRDGGDVTEVLRAEGALQPDAPVGQSSRRLTAHQLAALTDVPEG